MYFTLLAVFLVILVAALQGTDRREGEFPYKVPLDPRGLLQLAWNVSYFAEEVHFQILVKDLRYGLLFGMSDRGGFEHADLAVLWSDGHHSYFAVSPLRGNRVDREPPWNVPEIDTWNVLEMDT